MKLITVIIATYNSQNYIERCLRSLEDQTANRESYDIIVVNDGSTDNTANILESFANNTNITVILHEQNRGLSTARNSGINAGFSITSFKKLLSSKLSFFAK